METAVHVHVRRLSRPHMGRVSELDAVPARAPLGVAGDVVSARPQGEVVLVVCLDVLARDKMPVLADFDPAALVAILSTARGDAP